MKQNKFDQMVFSQNDICDLLMQGRTVDSLTKIVVDDTVDIDELIQHVERSTSLLTWSFPYDAKTSVQEFHAAQQQNWHMPQEDKELDIAQHILDLCESDAELQRCGAELLLYQEHNLFALLRYLKYLVNVMTENKIIWGIGRGSSVASYVLYKLGVHRIDSLHYNLDVQEFLR